jgi:hypothetical protein
MWDTIGGEHRGIEVRNGTGYVLARGGGFNVTDREATAPDWDVVLGTLLSEALRAEERREARRLETRLRRAWAALTGSADLQVVVDPAHEPRPPRDRHLERGLRDERGLGRREARKVARQLQARGQVTTYHGWRDEDVDALQGDG